ncbi:tyrosyl-tRNA synthetase [Zalerion maritima]|uniref:Tyrosine--tRNA ligase n=1 Tax=Zalerion maritima TaxID=339359 RepID=A0AAD5RKZ1_9PEZI|nr:tyrosyl-tRNA synthetase [Zalerion maritima]
MYPRAVGLPAARIAQSSRTSLLARQHHHHPALLSKYSLPILSSRQPQIQHQVQPQRRWVTTKYLAKVALANEEWAAQARKIEQGEGQYFWDFLEERKLISDVTGSREQMRKLFNLKRVAAYTGVDPTADSLHLGHLIAFMPTFQMYLHGYPAFTVLGGATAKVGDPSGRLTTREQESSEMYRNNLFKIHYQMKQIWINVEELARKYDWKREWHHKRGIENNGVWWNKQPLFDIIKRIGTELRMGPLLSRDTVKKKMSEGDGLSVSEFLYPVMQAWDWWQLWEKYGVQVQIGGSDQYGNIITGIDTFKIIRKNEPDPQKKVSPGLLSDPVGFTVPLLTNAKGQKFGKSAGNAIWLDQFKTNSHDLYAYLLKQPDDKVSDLLKQLTFVPTKEIDTLCEQHLENPSERVAQHRLAHEVVWLCHGQQSANVARARNLLVHRNLPAEERAKLEMIIDKSKETLDQVDVNSRPQMDMQLPRSVMTLAVGRLLQAAGLATSASDGHRLASAGGAYIGGKPGQKANENSDMPEYQVHWTPIKNWLPDFNENFLIDGKYIYLRKGKHTVRIVELVPDKSWDESGREYPGQEGTGELRKLRTALKRAERDVDAKKRKGLDIQSDLEALEEQGRVAAAVAGEERSGMLFPDDNERAARVSGLHHRTIRKLARGTMDDAEQKENPPPHWMQRGNLKDARREVRANRRAEPGMARSLPRLGPARPWKGSSARRTANAGFIRKL